MTRSAASGSLAGGHKRSGRDPRGYAFSAVVAAIAALAALLRFIRLANRGLYLWDEAKFALEGIRMQQMARSALGLSAALSNGKPVGSAKPGHALLIGASYAVAGVHDYAPLFMNAACSVAACILLAVFGARLFGATVGAVAALLLAVSEYDVMYARSALSESDAALLFLAGVTLWLWSAPATGLPARGPRLLASAILLGGAFSTNYRLVVYIAVVVAVDAIWSLRESLPLWRLLTWLGVLVIPGIWLLAGIAAAASGPPMFLNEITGHPASYAAEVVYQLHQGKQSVVRFAPLIYGAWYLNRTGVAATLLVALGIIWSVLRPSYVRSATVALVAVPYCAFALAPFIVPRNLVAALPFAALLSAIGLVSTARWRPPLRAPGLAVASVALALAVIGSAMSWRLTEQRSGFAAVAALIRKEGERTLTSSEVMAFYLHHRGGTCESPSVPLRLTQLAADIRAGYTLAVLERHHQTPVTAYITRHARLVHAWPVFGGPNLGESPVASENGTWPNPHERPETVSLYDLRSLTLPHPGHARPSRCLLRVPI